MDKLGTSFVNASGEALGAECVTGYKLVMVLHSANWWPGCTPFKASLKELYNEWNKDGAKNLQVVFVSGDKDQGGFDASMKDMPWVGQPMGTDKAAISELVPCTGYPTPGVINGTTGEVIDADCFGKVDEKNYGEWMAKVWWSMSFHVNQQIIYHWYQYLR